MSTTTSDTIAYRFADGSGVVLMLTSGVEVENVTVSKIPKYLSVSWFSPYPDEEELLFYGDNVRFKIHDIIETQSKRRHEDDLLALNEFQNMVQNRCVDWKNSAKWSSKIIKLIMQQKEIKLRNDRRDQNRHDYTQDLFGYFCDHPKTTSIGINNYNAIQEDLKMVLLFNQKRDGDKPPQKVMTILHLVHLFQHLTEIKFNNLKLNEMKQYGQSFINSVIKYLKISKKNKYDIRLMKVMFQSEPQQIGKNDPTLHNLISMNSNKNQQKLTKKAWTANYMFDFNSLTHSLTFTNDNKAIANRINPLHLLKLSIQSTQCKWMDRVSYFMQVLSIKMDCIRIQIECDRINQKMDRRFRLKHIETTLLTIHKNTNIATITVPMDDVPPEIFHVALFDTKNTDDPIPNSNQIRLKLLRNKNKYPPHNTEYKPKPVDTSTVFSIRDEKSATVYIYWCVPSFSFGDITYKLIEDDGKEDTIIDIASLPYAKPFAKMPLSFRIVTQTTVDGIPYASDLSKLIVVDYSSQMINPWTEFPKLLQILSVDVDEIEIQLTLKQPTKQKMKFMVQCTDDNNRQWTQRFTVHRNVYCAIKDMEVKPNTEYSFVIVLNGAQISNVVSARTPVIDFDPNDDGYSPSPPSMQSVRKYYDENKANVLFIWSYPTLVFGDRIVYEVKVKQIDKKKKKSLKPFSKRNLMKRNLMKMDQYELQNKCKRLSIATSSVKLNMVNRIMEMYETAKHTNELQNDDNDCNAPESVGVKEDMDSQFDEFVHLPYEMATTLISVSDIEMQIRTVSIIDNKRFEGKWSAPLCIQYL
eukprot:244380_1